MGDEVRKTSLGMQAMAVAPLASAETWRKRPGQGREHAIGMAVTLGIHGGLVALVIIMNLIDRGHGVKKEEPYLTIEAGLAIKKKASAKKSPLPQKDLAPKVKPPDVHGIAHNPDVKPPEKKKHETPPKDAVDPRSVFEKYRRMDTGDTMENEDNEGSEFGTLDRQKGDPYIGELIGRMTTDFVVPSVVRDTNLVTWGCVKLDENGKIQDRKIDPDHKAKSYAFNSAVEDRLKQTTDMEQPVPNYLKAFLVGKFVCATYTSKRE